MKKKQTVEQFSEDGVADLSPLYASITFDSEVPEWEGDGPPAMGSFLEAFDLLSWNLGFAGGNG